MKHKLLSIKRIKISFILLIILQSCFIISCTKTKSIEPVDNVNQSLATTNTPIDNAKDLNMSSPTEENNNTDAVSSDHITNADYQLSIDASNSYEISDLLYGLFLEDINFAIDGGLYAEMVKNRSFEYTSMAKNNGFHGYSVVGDVSYEIIDGNNDQSYLNPNNTHYLRLKNKSNDYSGIKNEGFLDGMNIEANTIYDFSVFLRTDTPIEVIVQLKNESGTILAESLLEISKKEWWKYNTTLTTSKEIPENASLHFLISKGTIDVDMVSLFPVDTYKNRNNGLRKDLAIALEELTPKFLRFPGGCVVEGETLENAYDWKDSIGDGLEFSINGEVSYGDVATRPLSVNIWGDDYKESNHPYYMTYGVGFYEYFLLSEDLNCEPIPIVNAGLSCQIQGTKTIGTAYEELDINSIEFKEYIQDALDLVEFCKGDATTKWGAIRVSMGHEEPFALNYIGIGNEQWGNSYFARYEAFKDAFEQAAMKNPNIYGGIQLIIANGPTANDKYAWNKIKLYGPDYASLVDEHYYMPPSWFLANTNRYDSYNRESTPVFLGEYAAKSNTMEAALSEAAFMTGLERNGDIVKLASYAPLFGNSVSYQWAPDLIWFKSKQMWNSANFYVQKIFSNNKGTRVLHSFISTPATVNSTTEQSTNTTNQIQNKLYQVVSTDDNNDLIIKFVNVSEEPLNVIVDLKGYLPSSPTALISTLASESLTDINTLTNPEKISIKEESISIEYTDSSSFNLNIPKYCVFVVRIPQLQH